MKQLCGTLAVTLTLVSAGCSRPAGPAPGDPPSPAPTLTVPRSTGSDTLPPAGSPPPSGCLDGSYRVARFRAPAAGDATTGTGGALSMTFDGGSFVVRSGGDEPGTIVMGGKSGDLALDGELTGRYSRPTGNLVTFTAGKNTGTVSLRDRESGEEGRITPDQLAEVLVPTDTAAVTCTGDQLTIENQRLNLELTR